MLIQRWLSNLKAGLLRTPQQIVKASSQEAWSRHDDKVFERTMVGVPDDDIDGWQALDRLTVPVHFFTQEIHLRQQERADWQLVQPDIKLFAARFVEECRKKQIPLFVHSAFRTAAQQKAVFRGGNSKASSIWTAPHCQGEAVDIIHARYAWQLTKAEWAMLGKIGKNLAQRLGVQITWGGDFKSLYDPAHWELTDWRDRRQSTIMAGQPIHKTTRLILKEMTGHSTSKSSHRARS